MTTVYLNGKYLPLENASISVMDRGFLFGDGVYEVIPVFGLKPFRVHEHLKRFSHSLNALGFDLDVAMFVPIINELVAQTSASAELSVYLQVTRGAAPIRDLLIPDSCQPTIFAYCMPIPFNHYKKYQAGVSAITVPDLRWGRCDIKSLNLLPNILMRKKAEESDALEAIFIRAGLALEGTSSNLFMVKNNVLYTPPLSEHLLGGITRELVLKLASDNNIAIIERDIQEEELSHANELLLTSSTKEILPVTRLNDQLVNSGKIGPYWKKLIKLYQDFKKSF